MVEATIDSVAKQILTTLPYVSRETFDRLESYVSLLQKWQKIKNLVSPHTLNQVWLRHVADSAQLIQLAPQAKVWLDMGCGAGFPGVVVACFLQNQPDVCIHLVESNQRKAAFLVEVVRQLALPAKVHPVRVEQLDPSQVGSVDVVTARALAPLSELIALAQPFLSSQSCALFLKGEDVNKELMMAQKDWSFTSRLFPSLTENSGHVLLLQTISSLKTKGLLQ